MDEIAKKLGFNNETEMYNMISDIDLSTSDKIDKFKKNGRIKTAQKMD